MRGAVQVQGNVIAFGTGLVCPPQHGGVVAAHFRTARAVGRGPVEVVENQAADGVDTVVHPRGQDVDTKGILVGWRQAQLGAGPVYLRAHVHGGPRVVGRDPFGIESDRGAAGVYEHVDGDRRHRHELGAVLHADGIPVGAEDLDRLVTGGAEGLEPLVGLLAVVEGGGHAMDADKRVGDEFERGPFARLVGIVRLDVAIDCRDKGHLSVSGRQKAQQTRIHLPSRMRKPMLAQSRVLDGGGGNEDMATMVVNQLLPCWAKAKARWTSTVKV